MLFYLEFSQIVIEITVVKLSKKPHYMEECVHYTVLWYPRIYSFVQ